MTSTVPISGSPYAARWRHRDKLLLRVWPKFKETHLAIARLAEIPIDGLLMTKDGHAEARYHSRDIRLCAFELRDEDVDMLAAAPAAGASLRLDEMVVHAPGTNDEKVKKECWLEIPFDAYDGCPTRTRNAGTAKDEGTALLRNFSGSDMKTDLAQAGYSFDKIVAIESVDEIDEDTICREAVEKNALIVFSGRAIPGARARQLIKRAQYWIVPGRAPEEDGGIFRGYQFSDRFVRWIYRCPEAERGERLSAHMEKMHEVVREQGRTTRRVYFTDSVINRFAERVGMSRQRVASRFLDDGIIDWLIRSADAVKPKPFREKEALFTGKITAAVSAIEFYYRTLGQLNQNNEKV